MSWTPFEVKEATVRVPVVGVIVFSVLFGVLIRVEEAHVTCFLVCLEK